MTQRAKHRHGGGAGHRRRDPVGPHQGPNIGYHRRALTAIGIQLKEVRVVADDEARSSPPSTSCERVTTYVFTTGGIGPTHDDITADCIAKAFGVAIDHRSAGEAAAEAHLHAAAASRRRRHGCAWRAFRTARS